jgi:uncharacterized protein (TIGR03067 family)
MWGLDDFRGTWQAIWLEADGRVRPAEETRKTRVMVSSDRYVLRLRGHDFEGVIIGADPAQGPNAVDFLRTGGPAGAGQRIPGIYLLEGDELTVCVAPPGGERPREFDCRAGSGCWLYLLRRVSFEPQAEEPDAGGRHETQARDSPAGMPNTR